MRMGIYNPKRLDHKGIKPLLSGLATLILLISLTADTTNAQTSVIPCATNCQSCFGTASNQCMTCKNGFVMLKYQCVANCNSISGVTGYTLDTNDNICKLIQGAYDFACQPGTFNQASGSPSSISCSSCSQGSYCESYSLTGVQASCDAGYFCQGGSILRSPLSTLTGSTSMGDICPAGSFCASGASAASACTGGYFCPDEFMSALGPTNTCNKGFYCSGGALTPNPNGPAGGTVQPGGDICPKGNYCGAKSSSGTQCPSGTYMPYLGAYTLSECVPCTVGQYCGIAGLTAPSGGCTSGYYCTGGSSTSQQNRCPLDNYCPASTLYFQSCPQGQFTRSTGSANCEACPAGSFCRGTGQYNACPNGYFCQNDNQYPCPKGTYMSTATGQTDTTQCLACPAGYACKTPNLLTTCSSGFYCFTCSGATNCQAAQTETPNNPDSASSQYQFGGMCIPGQWSNDNAISPSDCAKGYYCPNYASNQQIQCPAGFYCPTTGASGTSDSSKYIMCPVGNYCPQGSYIPTPCPFGTYSKSQGATQVSECILCPPGLYCPGGAGYPYVNVPGSSYNCQAGYYCASGSQASNPVACAKGYACPQGTVSMILCEAGTYQDQTTQQSCKACPQGNFCDGTDSTVYATCPQGSYCPTGTKFGSQYPCPPGTYSTSTGLFASSQCTKCTNGFYCQFPGQTSQTTKILARYHANGIDGQTTPNPYICPQAMYCPAGTMSAIMCPNGYWTNWKGASAQTDCITCQRGKFCNFGDMAIDTTFISFMQSHPSWALSDLINNEATMLQKYYGNCNPGYICLEGATSASPSSISIHRGYPCPIGYYCTSGAMVETPCPPGTYNDQVKKSVCTDCPAGYFCPDFAMTTYVTIPSNLTANPYSCLAGSYCPGSNIYPIPCPPGTYNSPVNSVSESDCLACPAEKYCDTPGQISYSDVCAPGFICTGGADRPGQYVTVYNQTSSTGGQCPIGYYCLSGGSTAQVCASTLYQPAQQTSKCENCPPGYYCQGGSQIQPCSAGYYCNVKSNVTAPDITKATMGGICPIMHYCVSGTSYPLMCPDGQTQMRLGKQSCDNCIAGFTCKAGIIEACPVYKVCESNSSSIYPYARTCPGGYYLSSSQTGIASFSKCIACPSTEFCQASRIVGPCAPGYVCLTQADAHKPNIDYKAYPCPIGYYCGEGALTPIPCPVGTFTNSTGAKQVSECTICQPGQYCSFTSVIPFACPPGYYCPMGSEIPTECPKGTFQPYQNKSQIDDCLPCMGGYYCNKTALGNILALGNQYLCPYGSFCPKGDNIKPIPCLAGTYLDVNSVASGTSTSSLNLFDSLNNCNYCPKDYYCMKGTNYRFQYPCKNGFLCPLGSGDMIPCPAGFTCKRVNNEMVQTICPAGNYCPMGSANPHPCDPDQVCLAGSTSPAQGGQTAKDCQPGQYLAIDKCKPCIAGFVCDNHANQKYPVYPQNDGGTQCPAGYYCPTGSTTATAIKCPAGTYRLNVGGKTKSDCYQCPQDSAATTPGSKTCVVCGSGSTNSPDFTTCNCNGAFRTWQQTTNSCVCQTGFQEPTVLNPTTNNVLDLDCIPVLAPTCSSPNFINSQNQCVPQSSCVSYSLCPGSGSYDSVLNSCFCNNVNSNPASYCDSTCQNSVLKAYWTQKNQIFLQAGSNSKTYPPNTFTDSTGSPVDFSGLQDSCSISSPGCPITAMSSNGGSQQASLEAGSVFLKVWKKDFPNYESPYGSSRLLSQNETGRLLATGAQPVASSINCLAPRDSMSFAVSATHFPVYIRSSIYNTDPNYDYGAFTKLQTMLVNAGVAMDTFYYSFSEEGVFVFGDYQTPDTLQTIILVTNSANRCQGQRTWPLTAQNMKQLGILPKPLELKQYDSWLHIIPPFFIILAFLVICCQQKIEARIEKRELELRIKREGGSIDMAKYFKKSQDKFDKLEYLADLYKLIKENLDEINHQIADNHRRTEEENRDNMHKMLADKHSIIHELKKGKGDTNLEDIRSGLMQMLSNLRFSDGRSLEELYKEQQIQSRLSQEQARLVEIDMKAQLNDDSESEDDENQEQEINIQDNGQVDEKDLMMTTINTEMSKDVQQNEMISDPALYDDLLKAREQMKAKRDMFNQSIDKNINDEEREIIMNRYDEQMQKLEREMLKDQEDQANYLKAKLAQRQKLGKQVQQVANDEVKHNLGQISDLMKQIEDFELEKDDLEESGINSRVMKNEREKEMKARIAEVDKEKDSRLAQMREDYMNRIKQCKNGVEKERILEEMGERLKSTEESLEEDRKRQEANLMKLLKARQKKNLKQTIKKIEKEREELFVQVDHLKINVDLHKADVYATQGVKGQTGLVIEEICKKVNKIISQTAGSSDHQIKFNGELTPQEKDDLQIEKAQLNLIKEKELKAIDVQVEEELDAQTRKRKQDRKDEYIALQIKVQSAKTAEEKGQLMQELANVDRQMQHEAEEEKNLQGLILEERRRRKADRMQIRKMRIEHDQLEDILHKELSMNNTRFKAQLEIMNETASNLLTKEVKDYMTPEEKNKEQALIMISETNDELLERMLKMLQSKQFFDLSRHLQCLQQQIATDQLIKIKEIHSRFDLLKEQAIHDLTGTELNDELSKLHAQRILECQLTNESISRSIKEKDSIMRQKQEVVFFKERKDLITSQNGVKRSQVSAIMAKFPQEKSVQDIGAKLIKRIDNNQEDEIAELEKDKDAKVERAKLRIIAENEEELQIMQDNLNQAMEKEESMMNEQLEMRKAEILKIKKQNLDDRLRMATGEMSQEQVKLLKDQYEQEFENLDSAIRNEKQQQMQKMRQAMLQRRIDKESKRKLAEQEREETKRREAVHRMNAGMAKVFREFVEKKSKEVQHEQLVNRNQHKEQLKAKLSAWQRKVNFEKVERGGEDTEVWSLTKKQEEIVQETTAADALKPTEQKIDYTVNELFLRILKVERMVTKVQDFTSPQEMANIINDINEINSQLHRNISTPMTSQKNRL